eukprot:COSAG02_NODE_6820_length_3343_cov_1.218557_3_plen_80_part_00
MRSVAWRKGAQSAFADILLQPCIRVAEDAMMVAMGASREQFRSTCGVVASLDDCTIVTPPRMAAIELTEKTGRCHLKQA